MIVFKEYLNVKNPHVFHTQRRTLTDKEWESVNGKEGKVKGESLLGLSWIFDNVNPNTYYTYKVVDYTAIPKDLIRFSHKVDNIMAERIIKL